MDVWRSVVDALFFFYLFLKKTFIFKGAGVCLIMMKISFFSVQVLTRDLQLIPAPSKTRATVKQEFDQLSASHQFLCKVCGLAVASGVVIFRGKKRKQVIFFYLHTHTHTPLLTHRWPARSASSRHRWWWIRWPHSVTRGARLRPSSRTWRSLSSLVCCRSCARLPPTCTAISQPIWTSVPRINSNASSSRKRCVCVCLCMCACVYAYAFVLMYVWVWMYVFMWHFHLVHFFFF